MAVIGYYCPSCGERFPWFISRLQRTYSFFEGTKIKCSKCGRISRMKVSLWKALLSWTVTVVLIFAFIPFGAKHLAILVSHLLKPLRDGSPGVYDALGGAFGGLVGGLIIGLICVIGFRQGLEVVLEKERGGPLSRAKKIQKWVEAIFPFAFAAAVLICYLVFLAPARDIRDYAFVFGVILLSVLISRIISKMGKKRR